MVLPLIAIFGGILIMIILFWLGITTFMSILQPLSALISFIVGVWVFIRLLKMEVFEGKINIIFSAIVGGVAGFLLYWVVGGLLIAGIITGLMMGIVLILVLPMIGIGTFIDIIRQVRNIIEER